MEWSNDEDRDSPGSYPFALSAEQERRAGRLHAESIVFDLVSQGAGSSIFSHYPEDLRADLDARIAGAASDFDRFLEAFFWPYEMSRLGRSNLVFEWLQSGGLTVGPYDVPVYSGRDPLGLRFDELREKFQDLPWLRLVTSCREIRQAKSDGMIAAYGFWQPVVPIPLELKAIDAAYCKGLRSLMLTYNRMDHVGVGCTERVDAGLSRFGEDVVRHCNDLGIIVDVSHCGLSTTLDACRISRKPVNANHSVARGLSAHARGKSDDALRAIAATGGVIGVAAVPSFLSDKSYLDINSMLDHIDYIASITGWQHVAIGTDWPLQAPEDALRRVFQITSLGFRGDHDIDVSRRLSGFNGCRDLPNITRGLVNRGYTDEQVRGVLGENALRVFSEICG